MSTTGFVFKQLRDDRERTIYLEAFWEGVYASADLAIEMRNLEKEWSNGRLFENKETSIQQELGTVQGSRKVVRFPGTDRERS